MEIGKKICLFSKVKKQFFLIFHGSPIMSPKKFEAPLPPMNDYVPTTIKTTNYLSTTLDQINTKNLNDSGNLRSVIVIDSYPPSTPDSQRNFKQHNNVFEESPFYLRHQKSDIQIKMHGNNPFETKNVKNEEKKFEKMTLKNRYFFLS